MKRKTIWAALFFLVIAVCAVLWFAFNVRSFDQIDKMAYGFLDCEIGQSFTVVRSGEYPGFSDTPVSWEGGRGYRTLYNTLRKPRYLVFPGFFAPPDGGIAIWEHSGCTPVCIAYWADGLLWLPADNERWRPCLPLSHGTELEAVIAELAAG